uniref:ATP synthase complex subunit 8 n=1 Tax=Tomoxia bucephala TaxID=295979 RepID=A0A343C1Y6_9CUCU|nr:ATP synthase F0 subunit 8 [Tomoxia bucephala]
MPQMAPLSWTLLMIMFIVTLMIFSSLNFYSFNYSSNHSSLSIKKKNMNWKW